MKTNEKYNKRRPITLIEKEDRNTKKNKNAMIHQLLSTSFPTVNYYNGNPFMNETTNCFFFPALKMNYFFVRNIITLFMRKLYPYSFPSFEYTPFSIYQAISSP